MVGKKSHQGVALITVMLIVALAAIIAAQMTTRLQMQMQRSVNIGSNQQAYWYAMGAEEFSKRVLMTAFKDDKDVTHLGQIWAQEETTYPVEFGEITGQITDLQSCFNLNALATEKSKPNDENDDNSGSGDNNNKDDNSGDKENEGNNNSNNGNNKTVDPKTILKDLIVALNVDGIGEFEAESMTDSLTDWLDADGFITGTSGAEDDDYASREFPYLAANNYLASVSELRVVEHFTPQVIVALKPYVCVLENTNLHKININTISAEHPELLQALLSSNLDDAQQVLSARSEEGFESLEEFYNLPELSKIKLSEEQKKQFVVDSDYFKLRAKTSFNNSYFTLNSVMKVMDDQQINIISRTIGQN
ncbi:type II secretion system minor pseudopilin GspK [Litorilituus lipolyticus]|nr:type II secretion system minor pseudopilin GspK [Litorilituus lipolyticus]